MSNATPPSKVAIPPNLAHQSAATPLPGSLNSALLAALYASPDTIPRLQTTLSAALDTTPPPSLLTSNNATTQAEPSSFSNQLHALLLALVRAARTASSGNAALDEAAIAEEVMSAVRRARAPDSGTTASSAVVSAKEVAQERLHLDARAREEIVRVVRQEVARVAVVRDDSFDTPLGRMY